MTEDRRAVDVLIIGSGIAGVSLAYFLAERGTTNVLVVEREPQAGYHATGRSAATVVELDPIGPVQQLKILGARFLRNPPPGFSENPVLEQRGVVCIYCGDEWAALQQRAKDLANAGMRLRLLTPAQVNARVDGVLDETSFDGAALLPDDGFIDVHELLSSYSRNARERGVRFQFRTEVRRLLVDGDTCHGVETNRGTIEATHVVNASGAWAGEIGRTAGATPIELTPLRRSIAIFAPPDGVDMRSWPLVWSDPHEVYFRPESTGVLFCPMDQVRMSPGDPSADEHVIAAGLERLRVLAPALVPRSLGRRWAGLRTFAPDRVPVVGPDPRLRGFFWLAGQGGCGIETSGALGRIAADLLIDGETDHFDARLLSPQRFAV